jgi:hypothetical protein
VAGAIGAVAGTLGGYEARCRLVSAIGGKDFRSLCSKMPLRSAARFGSSLDFDAAPRPNLFTDVTRLGRVSAEPSEPSLRP